MITSKSFHSELQNGVATLTLDREQRLNALTFEIYEELAVAFESLDRHDDVRSVVITGRGRGFCSGGDQDDIIKHLLGRDAPALLAFTRATGRLIHAMRACRRPIVAAINGTAVGAGAVIACAADLRIAAANAKFGFIFPAVGLCGADMGAMYLLPRIVGLGHASELLLFGDIIPAARALEIGLLHQAVPRAQLRAAVDGLLAELAQCAPLSVSSAKSAIERGHGRALDDALAIERECYEVTLFSEDRDEGLAAFAEGRPPVYRGR